MFEREIEQNGSLIFEKRGRNLPSALGRNNPGLPQDAKNGGTIISSLDSTAANAIHKQLMGHYRRELARQEDARLEMSMDEDFVDHIQWSQQEIAELAARGQVPMVLNVTATAVNWVLGTERRASMDWKVLSRTKEGVKHAEFKSELMKHAADVNREPFQQSRAFREAVCAGISFLEGGQSDESNAAPVYGRCESWRNMLWDSTAIEWDMNDARYMFRTKWVDGDIACSMFPKRQGAIEFAMKKRLSFGISDIDYHGDQAMDSLEQAHFETFGGIGLGEFAARDRVRLIEAWFTRPTVVPIIKGGQFNGEMFDEWSPGHWREIRDERASLAAVPRRTMHCAIMTDGALLSYRLSPYRHNRYPFTPVWGNRRARDGMPYGLVRGLRDLNRDINKRASKSLHILSAKTVFVEEDAVEDLDELRDEAARPDAVIVYKTGRPAPQIATDHNLAAAHMDMLRHNVGMIHETSGVTGENLGQATNAVSGKAILAKQNQGALTTSHYFDNLRFARAVHGEKQLVNIEQFYTAEFQYRITNARGNAEYRTINTDPLDGDDAVTLTRADFVVSEDDWRATVRQAQAESLLDLFSKLAATAPQIVIQTLDLLVEALDVPKRDEMVKRIRQITGQADPDADPNNPDPDQLKIQQQKDAQAQLAARAAEAELSGAEAKARETAAKAQKLELENKSKDRAATDEEIQRIRSAIAAAIEIAGAQQFAEVADTVLRNARAAAAAPDNAVPALPAPTQDAQMPVPVPQQAQPQPAPAM